MNVSLSADMTSLSDRARTPTCRLSAYEKLMLAPHLSTLRLADVLPHTRLSQRMRSALLEILLLFIFALLSSSQTLDCLSLSLGGKLAAASCAQLVDEVGYTISKLGEKASGLRDLLLSKAKCQAYVFEVLFNISMWNVFAWNPIHCARVIEAPKEILDTRECTGHRLHLSRRLWST